MQAYVRDMMPIWKDTHPGVEGMTVAVMGCVVNGPGESKAANIGISLPGTGESPNCPVYIDGQHVDDAARDVRGTGAGLPAARRRLRGTEVPGDRPHVAGLCQAPMKPAQSEPVIVNRSLVEAFSPQSSHELACGRNVANRVNAWWPASVRHSNRQFRNDGGSHPRTEDRVFQPEERHQGTGAGRGHRGALCRGREATGATASRNDSDLPQEFAG